MQRFFHVMWFLAVMLWIQAVISPASNYNTLRAEKKKIILQHADTIEGKEISGTSYRSVSGNVVFRHGALTLKCDSAAEDGKENNIVLNGHVSFSDNSIEIYGQHGMYNPQRGIGELTGNVRGRMLDNALAGKSHRAVINRAAGEIILDDDVIIWHRSRQVSGNKIVLHFRETGGRKKRRIIDNIEVKEGAFFAARDTLSPGAAAYDQFSAKNMMIRLNESSKITSITLSEQAESLYHLYNDQQQLAGINYSSGDIIRLLFRDNTLSQVKVSGNVEGKQYPASFRNQKNINLSHFVWRERENPFRKEQSPP